MEKNIKFDEVANYGEDKIELSDLRELKEKIEAELSVLSKQLEDYENQWTIAHDSLNELVEAIKKKEKAICSKTSDEYLALCEDVVSKKAICLEHVSNYDNEAHKNCKERINLLSKKLSEVNKRISILRRKSDDSQNHYGN